MPDFGWAYINLDVLQNIEGPANVTGTIAIVKDSTTLSGSKFLAYATGTSKVGVGLDFPSVLPTSQLHISASAGEQIAVTVDGDLSASSNISASFFYGDGSKLQNVGGGGSPGGSNTQVQFNDGGTFGGSANFTWDGSTVAVNGNISGSGTLQNVGSIDSTGNIASSGSVSGSAGVSGSEGSFGSITVGGSTHSSLVDVTGTPAMGQITLWSDANTIQGSTSLTYDGTTVRNDNNLSGSGTLEIVGTISSTGDIASSGSISSSAGELGSITVGGTTHTNLVDVSGTPNNGQIALWSDANTVQGALA